MNRLWTKIKAFTLAELVIVMLIIAVVAGVSIKITKAKLDSVVSYTYYSAYNTLRSVAGEMMADSDASEEYGELSYNYKEKSLVDKFIDNYLIPKSYALKTEEFICPICHTKSCTASGGCKCIQIAGCLDDPNKGEIAFCPDGYLLVNGKCIAQIICSLLDSAECTSKGGLFDLTTCECSLQSACDANKKTLCLAGGGKWSDSSCECSQLVQECANMADMVMCAAKHGVWSGYPNCTCNDGECDLTQNDCSKKQVLDKENCQCRDKKVTLPKTGKEFCEAFVSYTNTTTYNCNGNNTAEVSSAVSSGDFKNLSPDIVLRNGMKVYNAKNDYVKIDELSGNIPLVNNYETTPLMKNKILFAGVIIKDKLLSFYNTVFKQPIIAYKNKFNDNFGLYIQDLFSQRAYAYDACSFISAGNPYDKEHCTYNKGVWCSGASYEESYNYGDGCFKCCSPRKSPTPSANPTAAECKAQNKYLAMQKYGYQCLPCPSGYVVNSSGTGCDEEPTPAPQPTPTPNPSPSPDDLDEEGLPPNLNEHGYIVYIDIDGSKGDSVLYEDVFPFYMTLEGRVVPAFKAGEEAGGNSTSHLTVSVQYDIYTSGDRRENWMSPKGTDFQHAACMSGYVTANTYCSGVDDAQLASKRAICSQTSSDCRMKVNKPLRF